MLVLTRKLGEKIIIAGAIEVTVTELKDGCVKLGINAPRAIPVHRQEVAERIRKEKEEALFVRVAESNRLNEESAKELGMSIDTILEEELNNLEEGI